MVNLVNKKCIPCEGGTLPLNKEAIAECLKEFKTPWVVLDNKKISKEFNLADFRKAMTFVNRVAEVAETENHHPDIYIYYNKVVIELSTHAIGGLSENDFIVAAKIEKILK